MRGKNQVRLYIEYNCTGREALKLKIRKQRLYSLKEKPGVRTRPAFPQGINFGSVIEAPLNTNPPQFTSNRRNRSMDLTPSGSMPPSDNIVKRTMYTHGREAKRKNASPRFITCRLPIPVSNVKRKATGNVVKPETPKQGDTESTRQLKDSYRPENSPVPIRFGRSKQRKHMVEWKRIIFKPPYKQHKQGPNG